jgi:hypothetical protein
LALSAAAAVTITVAIVAAPVVIPAAGETTLAVSVAAESWAVGTGSIYVTDALVLGGATLAYGLATSEQIRDDFVAGGPGMVLSTEAGMAAIELNAARQAILADLKVFAATENRIAAESAPTWQSFRGQAQAIQNAVKAEYGGVEAYNMAAETGGAAQLTNGQLVQEIATRAESWGTGQGLPAAGGGPLQGTLKHDYAARLLDLYQSMYGSRGLETEVSFLNGGAVPYGTAGSVRLNVFEVATGTAWDYKFTLNPILSASRVQRIQ